MDRIEKLMITLKREYRLKAILCIVAIGLSALDSYSLSDSVISWRGMVALAFVFLLVVDTASIKRTMMVLECIRLHH